LSTPANSGNRRLTLSPGIIGASGVNSKKIFTSAPGAGGMKASRVENPNDVTAGDSAIEPNLGGIGPEGESVAKVRVGLFTGIVLGGKKTPKCPIT